MKQKYIFVTGGVLSSLGKGLTAAALALLLEKMGYCVAMLKLDPYLNVDPGTMNPYQHGEVYVTDDGAETDLDLGHYCRFTNSPLSRASTATSGQIYETVIKNERRGDYLGKTIQVIPHITDEIQRRIELCAKQEEKIDIVLVEIGGTVGDIESLPFLEAIRQFRTLHPKNCINIHLTYVPFVPAAGELKTKPTQHSCAQLREIGIRPDMLLCRAEEPLAQELKDKISLFCSVDQENVIDIPDVEQTIYELPLSMKARGIDKQITKLLGLTVKQPRLTAWRRVVNSLKEPVQEVQIALVGKYVDHQDAYKSVTEALIHAGIPSATKVKILPVDAEEIVNRRSAKAKLKSVDGVIVPGGFGERGWAGLILAAKYCRENKLPYFGICMGMQVLAVEFARNVLGLGDAHSTEVNSDTKDPIISLLTEQKSRVLKGATMRLGAYPCKLLPLSKAARAYGKNLIQERHRHRYEFNNAYRSAMENAGLIVSGEYTKKELVEILELKKHPFMLAVQFHPEFLSKPTKPHPLFQAFIEASIKCRKS